MKLMARIVIRPHSQHISQPDIIIGACLKDCSLKGNTVYEVVEFDGVWVLREVGESWMTPMYNWEEGKDGWTSEIGSLMRNLGNTLLLSANEYKEYYDLHHQRKE